MHSASPVNGVHGTPAFDHAAALYRDLRVMGATEEECQAYGTGLHHGNGIVFASETQAEADNALDIMNQHHSIETEEFEGSEGGPAGAHITEMGPMTSARRSVFLLRGARGRASSAGDLKLVACSLWEWLKKRSAWQWQSSRDGKGRLRLGLGFVGLGAGQG